MSSDPSIKKSGVFSTSNNIDIYWELSGKGTPLICCNGVGVSTFFWKYITQNFKEHFQILLWDYRGHGKSQRDFEGKIPNMSIEQHVKDLKELYLHLFPQQSKAVLIGHSMGCQVLIEFYKQNPENTRSLILMLGTAGRALETFGDNPNSKHIFRVAHKIARRIGPRINHVIGPLIRSRLSWPFVHKLSIVDPLYTEREDFLPYLTHLSSMNFLIFLEAAWQCQLHDAWSVLPNIQVPTLMIAGENDFFTPMHCARELTNSIPNAELMVLAEGTHSAIIEQPETINHRIERFFAENSVFPEPLQQNDSQ